MVGAAAARARSLVEDPMMARSSRILLAIAALALASIYVAPLWHIALKAPQYPEGLGMYIWANQITGDLRSINGLNHYIGMKEIHPEAIPELRLMGPIAGVLIGLGLLGAAWGRRAGLYLWTALFAAGALIGLADFWRWGYDYGHNLNPEAAIKIPGMSYQPPLIGPKQLLNFQATSWPATAGWLASGALVLVLVLSSLEWRRASRAAA
jgi:hypothetical protein